MVSRTVLVRAWAVALGSWAAALPLAALAASRTHAPAPVYAFGLVVYGLGSAVCHQLPSRSFHLWATQLPVCARCTGVYLGAALAASAVAVRGARDTGGGPASDTRRVRIVLAAAALPTLVSVGYEWAAGDVLSGWIRLLAGAPLGAAGAWLVARIE